MKCPTLQVERKLWSRGYKYVVCLDEVGRGALCGPVVAAAVMIQNTKYQIQNTKLRDSKKLSSKQREEFYKILTTHQAVEWGIGRVYPRVIDRINILEATKLAMKRAAEKLKAKSIKRKIDFLILDGNMRIDLPFAQKAIVKADEKVFSCAAASIIAKVQRDRLMRKYHKKYPGYGFDKHKGYGTREHAIALKKLGASNIHRITFAKTFVKN